MNRLPKKKDRRENLDTIRKRFRRKLRSRKFVNDLVAAHLRDRAKILEELKPFYLQSIIHAKNKVIC